MSREPGESEMQDAYFLELAADLARSEAERLKRTPLIHSRDEWSVSPASRLPSMKQITAIRADHTASFEEGIRRLLQDYLERGKAEGREALADAMRTEMAAFVNGPGNYDRFREHFAWEDMYAAQRGAEFLMAHIRKWMEG